MISEKIKKSVAIIMILIMGVMMLIGCSGKKERENETNPENTPAANEVTPTEKQQIGDYFPVFKKVDFIKDKKQIKGVLQGLAVAGDKLVLRTNDWDGIKATNYVYIISQADGSVKELDLEEEAESIEVINSKDDNVYLYMASGFREGTPSYHIAEYDGSGNFEKIIDLSEFIGSDERCSSAFVGKDSEMILSTAKAVRIIKDDDITVIPDGVGSIKMVSSEDDDILLVIISESGTNVRKLNQEEKTFDVQKTMVSNANGGQYVCGGVGPFDFFFRKENMVYGVTFDGEENTEFIDVEKSGINPNFLSDYVITDENTAFFLCNGELIKMVRADESEVKEKTVLKAVAISVDSDIENLIYDFNAQSEDYRIEIKEYREEAWESDSFNLDVVKGELPDIYILEGQHFKDIPMEKMISLGMLEELDQYYENDDVTNKNDIIPSVYESMKINGKIYFGTPKVILSSLISITDYVGDRQGWTMKEFTDYLKSLPENESGFGMSDTIDDKINMLLYLFQYDYEEFIDFSSGKCSFDSDVFKALLEACDFDCSKNLYYDPNTEMDKVIKEGTVKFIPIFNSNRITALNMEVYNTVFEGKDCYPGFPGEIGYRARFEDCYAMSSQSNNKEGVWEFIRYVMSRKTENHLVKEQYFHDSIPVRNDSFELFIKKWTSDEEFEDEDGEVYEPISPISTGLAGKRFEIDKLSEKEEKQLRTIVESIGGRAYYNQDINNIIIEEAKYYFAGEKDIDEVCSLINNRVETYVSENQ